MRATYLSHDETEQHENDFLFGKNELHGCSCPAVAAGIHPRENIHAEEIAVVYDNIIREEAAHTFGFIAEEGAKEAWLTAIQELRKGVPEWEETSEPIEVGEQVAQELGWR